MEAWTDDGPRLVVIGGEDLNGRVIPLRTGVQVLGRAQTADVMVAHPDLSREHALLQWDGRTASIADAGSTNGTAVNGELIDGRRVLRRGDVVRLGRLQLRFEDASWAKTRPMPPVRLDNQIGRDNYGDVLQAGRDVNAHSWNVENRLE